MRSWVSAKILKIWCPSFCITLILVYQ